MFLRKAFRAASRRRPRGFTGQRPARVPRNTFWRVAHLLSINITSVLRPPHGAPDNSPQSFLHGSQCIRCKTGSRRETFDLFGIVYRRPPELRPMLTDYGFVGHPFPQGLPVIAQVKCGTTKRKNRVVLRTVSMNSHASACHA